MNPIRNHDMRFVGICVKSAVILPGYKTVLMCFCAKARGG